MPRASDRVNEPESHTEQIGEVTIGRRYQGPPESGNGGYVCGRLAEYIDGPATVRLLSPPPLETPLSVVRSGERLELKSGDGVVAWAHPAEPEFSPIKAPKIESARHGRKVYAGHTRHVFPGCFVCGVDRREGDGLLVHAGPVQPSDTTEVQYLVACDWTPHPNLCGEAGVVAERYVWAALDCPSGWAFLTFTEDIALLGELTVEILSEVQCGAEYILAGWQVDHQGRKHLTGSALFDANGNTLAQAQATWIVIDPPKQ